MSRPHRIHSDHDYWDKIYNKMALKAVIIVLVLNGLIYFLLEI